MTHERGVCKGSLKTCLISVVLLDDTSSASTSYHTFNKFTNIVRVDFHYHKNIHPDR